MYHELLKGLSMDTLYPDIPPYNSPIFDPKRPHPKQSYRSQQRAAKKRKRNKS